MKKIILVFMCLLANTGFAQEGDLEIPYPYYQTSFAKMTCESTQEAAIQTPAFFADKNVRFEKVAVSITLDRAILLADYTEAGTECRYNAVFAVDKRKFFRTLTLVESKALATNGADQNCENFKATLDQSLAFTPYKIDYDFVGVVFKGIAAECPQGNAMVVFNRIRRH